MRSREIQKLIDAVEAQHGPVELYGSAPAEEHGTCFTIADAPATFSVLTLGGTLPSGQYDVQIEGSPPGDYIFRSVVSLDAFLQLVDRFCGPQEGWPTQDEEGGTE